MCFFFFFKKKESSVCSLLEYSSSRYLCNYPHYRFPRAKGEGAEKAGSSLKGRTANLAAWINTDEEKNLTERNQINNRLTNKKQLFKIRNMSYRPETELAYKRFIIHINRRTRADQEKITTAHLKLKLKDYIQSKNKIHNVSAEDSIPNDYRKLELSLFWDQKSQSRFFAAVQNTWQYHLMLEWQAEN